MGDSEAREERLLGFVFNFCDFFDKRNTFPIFPRLNKWS